MKKNHKQPKSIKKAVTFNPKLGDGADADRYSGKSEASQTLVPHSSTKKQVDSVMENVVSITTRRKRANAMRRKSAMLKRIRQITSVQYAPEERLVRRAQRLSRKYVKGRYAGNRGSNYSKGSLSDKLAVDTVVDNNQSMMQNLSKRLLPQVRKAEYYRLQAKRRREARQRISNAAGLGIMHEHYTKIHHSLKHPEKHKSHAPAAALHKKANAMIAKLTKAAAAAQPKPAPKAAAKTKTKTTSTGKEKPKVGRGKHNNHYKPKPKEKINPTSKAERRRRIQPIKITNHGGTVNIHREDIKYRLKKQIKELTEVFSSFDPPVRMTAVRDPHGIGVIKKRIRTRGNRNIYTQANDPRAAYKEKKTPKPDGIVTEMVADNDNYANDNSVNDNIDKSVSTWAGYNVKRGGVMGTIEGYLNYHSYCKKNNYKPVSLKEWNSQFKDYSGHNIKSVHGQSLHLGVSLKNINEEEDKTKPPPLPSTAKWTDKRRKPFANLIDQELARKNIPPPPPVKLKKNTFNNMFKKTILPPPPPVRRSGNIEEASLVQNLRALGRTIVKSGKYSKGDTFRMRFKRDLRDVKRVDKNTKNIRNSLKNNTYRDGHTQSSLSAFDTLSPELKTTIELTRYIISRPPNIQPKNDKSVGKTIKTQTADDNEKSRKWFRSRLKRR